MIVFLDIDGVLNCKNSRTYWSPEHPETYGLDTNLCGNLRWFLNNYPTTKVVIHSGWIKHLDDPNYEWDMGRPESGVTVKSQLPKVIEFLGSQYIGCVPYLKGVPKAGRILKWLESNNYRKEESGQVIIIDDDQSEYQGLSQLAKGHGFKVHFTNSDTGLDWQSVTKLVELTESESPSIF